jgi:hypothetical protein
MNENSIRSYKVNFRKIYFRVFFYGSLFFIFIFIALYVVFSRHMPAYFATFFLIGVVGLDIISLYKSIRGMINDTTQNILWISLHDESISVSSTPDNEVKVIPFSRIKNMKFGNITAKTIHVYSIALQNTSDEYVITSEGIDSNYFFEFTTTLKQRIESFQKKAHTTVPEK